ncbi:MAG: hypothetical protein OEM52_14335 [bacterium]|nr:hypothetical protein [bacterium]
MRYFLLLVLSILFAGLLASCESDDPTDTSDLIATGKLYTEDIALGSVGNGFRCITCHTPPETDRVVPGQVYVGYPLQNIAHRTGYWGTSTYNLRGAVNRCIDLFMHGQPLTENGETWSAMNVYFNSISPVFNDTLRTFQTERYFVNSTTYDTARYESIYDEGDPVRGEISFRQYCFECHGFGLSNAPEIRYQPERTIASIAIKVRNSTFTSASERMAFFSVNALPSDTLRNIISYLRLR